MTNEVAVCTEMMLEGPELVIRDPMNSILGVAMKGLLETQFSSEVCTVCVYACVRACVSGTCLHTL